MSYDPRHPEEKGEMIASPFGPIETGRFPYGWRAVILKTLPEGSYRKQFSHAPKTILLGAPKRGGKWLALDALREVLTERQTIRCNECKPVRYIVWGDRSLRRVDKLLRKEFQEAA